MVSASAILKLKWDRHKDGVNIEEVKKELFEIVICDLESLRISKTLPTGKTHHYLTDVIWSLARKMIAATENTISYREVDMMYHRLKRTN